MQAEVRIDPRSRKVIINIEGLRQLSTRSIRQAFYRIGKDLKATAAELILEKPKHGRFYWVMIRGRRRLHQASAPGEAPANMTGNLRRSLDFEVVGADRLEFGYRENFDKSKGRGVIYGRRLEEGDDKISPRPGLLLSVKRNERNAIKHFEEQLKRAFKK